MSKSQNYADASFGVPRMVTIPGTAGTTMIITPLAGTATSATTATRTSTLEAVGFFDTVLIKRIIYTVKTAQTGAGCENKLDLYNGTTSVGALNVTTETALTVCTSSEINSTVTGGGYIRLISLGRSTNSDGQGAIGYAHAIYEGQYT